MTYRLIDDHTIKSKYQTDKGLKTVTSVSRGRQQKGGRESSELKSQTQKDCGLKGRFILSSSIPQT